MTAFQNHFFILLLICPVTFHSQIKSWTPAASCTTNTYSSSQDWSAQGGCWTFTDDGIVAQAGTMGLVRLYYKEKSLSNFECRVRLKKLAEGGAFGLLIRYDENTASGYTWLLFPHGEYRFATTHGETDSSLFQEPAYLHQQQNNWDTLTCCAVNDSFTLFLNGELLKIIHDDQYKKGRFGFFLSGDPRQKALFQIISIKEF